jgi:predicted amidohydrolase YtcJ
MTIKRFVARATIWAGVALLLMSLAPAEAKADDKGKADVVLRNGKIYTADAARSIKQAIAFSGNTILAAGDDADIEKLIGPKTKVVDLDGKLVLPGMFDTHIHPIIGAVNGAKCSLARVKATLDALKPVNQACLAKDAGGAPLQQKKGKNKKKNRRRKTQQHQPHPLKKIEHKKYNEV